MNDKIDFVITWVDGNDPAWRESRDRYAALEHLDIGGDDARYRDWDLLRYCFRSIEKFAPWVNRVFFVTCGHHPGWLDLDNPRLHIVSHKEFIPEKYLPTFNSNVIEFWLHKIQGLSEQFVYFNDDIFLLAPVAPSRFFKDGLPCDLGGMTFNLHDGMFGATVLNSRTLVNRHFDKRTVIHDAPSKWINLHDLPVSFMNLLLLFVRKHEFTGFVNPHLSQAFLKNSFERVWANCEKDLQRSCSNRFRDYSDLAFWLVRYWQLASNQFSPFNVKKDGQYFLMDDGNLQDIVNCIRRQKKRIICLNDSDRISDFEASREMIRNAFDSILPGKSSFEIA